MTTIYPDESRKQAVASIKRYFADVLEQDIGDLKAEMLLDYFLAEIAPAVYNQAIRDAQRYQQERVTDMDSALFALEFTYWQRPQRRSKP
jgi:uncharacterized protein (DUF2164 family)